MSARAAQIAAERDYVRRLMDAAAEAQTYLHTAAGRHGAAERAGRVVDALNTELRRLELAHAAEAVDPVDLRKSGG